jgi:hypothetical protein
MNPANVSSSGSLVRGASRHGIAIFTGSELRPRSGLRAEVTIVNLGALSARFRLNEVDASNGFSAGWLGLAIHEYRYDMDRRRIYLGEVGGVPDEGIELGRFAPGESRTYRFSVLLSAETPEREWARSAAAAYEWNAVQNDGVR